MGAPSLQEERKTILVPALHQLFSQYSEGLLMSAQKRGGMDLVMGGEKMDFSTFMLRSQDQEGQLMSWERFVEFAEDFHVTPELLDLDEMRVIYEMCADGNSPMFACKSKYSTKSKRERSKPAAASASLSIAKFVDILGRCALVAYNAPPYCSDYPDELLRVDHFVSGYLRLVAADAEGPDGWRAMVGRSKKASAHGRQKSALPKDNKHLGWARQADSKEAFSVLFLSHPDVQDLVCDYHTSEELHLMFDIYRAHNFGRYQPTNQPSYQPTDLPTDQPTNRPFLSL
jgi:hypothetical protein